MRLFGRFKKPQARPPELPTFNPEELDRLAAIVDDSTTLATNDNEPVKTAYPHLGISENAVIIEPARIPIPVVFADDIAVPEQPQSAPTAVTPDPVGPDTSYATITEAKRIYKQSVRNVLLSKLRSQT
jgi:hypothetical protein